MSYEYKMVQVPQNFHIKAKDHHGGEVAAYLEEIVNRYAQMGWEFYRTDNINVWATPGCLVGLFGKKAELYQYHVITFRKEK